MRKAIKRLSKILFIACFLTLSLYGIKKAWNKIPRHIPLPNIAGLETKMDSSDLKKAGLHKLEPNELQYLNKWIIDHPPPFFCGMKVVTTPSELEWVYASRKLNRYPSNQYYLSIGTIIQNEADYLKEWIEYHKLLGVEHFWIYNHLSTDHYLEILDPYIRSGEVDLIEWTVKQYPACQLTAIEDCIQQSSPLTHWLALIDVDEFLVPHKHDSMISFLKEYEEHSQILINWQIFGTSNLQSLPKEALIIEHLTYKYPTDFISTKGNGNQFVKSIVKPNHVALPVTSSHFLNLHQGYSTVNGIKQPAIPSTTIPVVHVEDIQLNHYWFRTLDYFFAVKVGRRQDVGDRFPPETVDWLLKISQSEQDLNIQRFVPKLKEAL